jgi:hypothetical protein
MTAPEPLSADTMRAFFREHGWSIEMDDRPGQAFDPFAAFCEAQRLDAARVAAPSDGLRARIEALPVHEWTNPLTGDTSGRLDKSAVLRALTTTEQPE